MVTEPDPLQDSLRAIAYGNSRFVAVGYNGHIWWSEDGAKEHWHQINDSSKSYYNSIAFGNGVFIAGSSAKVWRSTDNGLNWSSTPVGISNINGLTFGNGYFVALVAHVENGFSSGTKIFHSDAAGINWTEASIGVCPDMFQGVAYGNNQFVAIGYKSSNKPSVWCSTDGITWSDKSLQGESGDLLYGIAYGNNRFVTVGTQGTVYWSGDGGQTWNQPTTSPDSSSYMNAVIFGYDRFVAVGSEGKVWWSPNGEVWTESSIVGAKDLFGIAYMP